MIQEENCPGTVVWQFNYRISPLKKVSNVAMVTVSCSLPSYCQWAKYPYTLTWVAFLAPWKAACNRPTPHSSFPGPSFLSSSNISFIRLLGTLDETIYGTRALCPQIGERLRVEQRTLWIDLRRETRRHEPNAALAQFHIERISAPF